MNEARPIEIVGGGLAGLTLGLALCRAHVPTTIFESGSYPRHRVCGEFMAGLKPATLDHLGINAFVADAVPNVQVAWFQHGRVINRHSLPFPALSLSRHVLDARLAEAFVAAGGELRTHTRIDTTDAPAGRVFASGRQRGPRSEWLGLKIHLRQVRLAGDLEFHLGRDAYVGLCRIENNGVNVCGLFRKNDDTSGTGVQLLLSYLDACGLRALGERLIAGEFDPASFCATAGLSFTAPSATDRLNLGDAFAAIPPYTGHGMSLAFESASCALDPLIRWSRGTGGWPATLSTINTAMRARFGRRLRLARVFHPFVFSARYQTILGFLNRTGLLPLRALTLAVHR